MAKLRSIGEFTSLKEKTTAALRVRTKAATTITVGMGTCGIAAGARETVQAIMAELERLDIEAHVAIAGCLGKCRYEPLVTVSRAEGDPVIYGSITAERVPQLIQTHLIDGRTADQWVVGRLSSGDRNQVLSDVGADTLSGAHQPE